MAYGDIRVAERSDWLIERVATTGTLVLRRVGGTRAGELAVHRFLSSPYVSVANIVATLAARTAVQCAGRHVLAVQDTTEINFAGRDKKRRGFGAGGDGKTPGFFIHPVIAPDVETEAVVGLVDAGIWTRSQGRVAPRRKRTLEDKESSAGSPVVRLRPRPWLGPLRWSWWRTAKATFMHCLLAGLTGSI